MQMWFRALRRRGGMGGMALVLALAWFGGGCAADHYQRQGEAALVTGEYGAELDFGDVDEARLNAAVFHASNEARVRLGQRPVAYSAVLEEAAQEYAVRSAEKRFIEHEDSTRRAMRTPQQRVARAGAENPMVAENLATAPGLKMESGERYFVRDAERLLFSKTPTGPAIARHTYASFARRLVERWLDSPGHRKNLLHPEALELGCGASMYWENGTPKFAVVQNFQLYEPIRE